MTLSLDKILDSSRLARIAIEGENAWSSVPEEPAAGSRFEGLYGGIYDSVIQSNAVRRAVFSAWGGAQPLFDLDRLVRDASAAAMEAGRDAIIADIPCGGGVTLGPLAESQFSGGVLEIDIASSMLRRSVRRTRRRRPPYRPIFIRADALDLPLRDQAVDAVISINGLHVVPDPARFLDELARISRKDATLWLITPVDNRSSIRSRAILTAANSFGITPRTPPSVGELDSLTSAAGFREIRSYGGSSIVGRAYERR